MISYWRIARLAASPHMNPKMNRFEDEMSVASSCRTSIVTVTDRILSDPEADSTKRIRAWVWVWNNYPDGVTDQEFLEFFRGYFGDNLRFVAWSREIAPTTGTPHLQGFIYFHEAKVLGKPLKTRPGEYTSGSLKQFDRAVSFKLEAPVKPINWRPMKSDYEHNLAYCAKKGTQDVFTWGDAPAGEGPGNGRGARTDLTGLARKVIEGTITREEMYTDHPETMVRYSRGFEGLFNFIQPHRTERPYVLWMTGASGSGKSQFPERLHGRDKVYRKMNGGLFFNGYSGQDVCVLEEFELYSRESPHGWQLTMLLQLLDKYEITVDVKGGYVKFNSPFIYITSVKHPCHIFTNEGDLPQVLRRLDGICHITPSGEVVRDECYSKLYFDPNRPPLEYKVPVDISDAIARRAARHEEEVKKRQEARLMLTAKRELALRSTKVVEAEKHIFEDEA